jgi:hypothetical protein
METNLIQIADATDIRSTDGVCAGDFLDIVYFDNWSDGTDGAVLSTICYCA